MTLSAVELEENSGTSNKESTLDRVKDLADVVNPTLALDALRVSVFILNLLVILIMSGNVDLMLLDLRFR